MTAGPEREALVEVGPGRVLTVTRYGPADGSPVLYFHGAGDCSLALPTDLSVLDTSGTTILGIDRPGYGRSTRAPGRRLDDWVADVGLVADALGVDRFGLLAWSAGTVHALACAARLPRVTGCALYGTVAPPDMPDYASGVDEMTLRCAAAARERPEELRVVMAAMTADPAAFALGLAAAEHGGEALDSELAELLATVARRAFTQGSDPMVDDFEVIYGDWELDLDDVQCDVLLAVGSHDNFTPPTWSRFVAGRLRKAHVQEIPGAVHGDFLRPDVFDPLVTWLAAHPRA